MNPRFTYLLTYFLLVLFAGAPCLPDFPQLSADKNGGMEPCTRVESFDYFDGSEAAYILTLIFVLGSVIRKYMIDVINVRDFF